MFGRVTAPESRRFGIAFIVLGLLFLRVLLWHTAATNYDLENGYFGWLATITTGRWSAMRAPVGSYFPAYYDLLAVASYTSGYLSPISVIKLVPFVFDIIAAIVAYFFVGTLAGTGSLAQKIAPFCILAGPTVILNGSVWGQCDIIYTAFLLLAVLALMLGRGAWAVLAFGFALAFKLQAVFLCPFLLAMFLQKRIHWKHVLLLPVGWAIAMIPPLMNGASWVDYFILPFRQGQQGFVLFANIGNLWALTKPLHLNNHSGTIVGIILSIIVSLVIGIIGSHTAFATRFGVATLAAVSLAVMPYVMPEMHDRYFFPAEILLCLLACVTREAILPAVLLLCGSLIEYACYFDLALRHIIMTPIAFLLNTTAIVLLLKIAYMLPRLGENTVATHAVEIHS
jgi:Gpi18-like mannosyltransferase